MVKVFFTGHSLMENSSAANASKSGMEVDGVSVFGNFAGPKINAFSAAITYCRRMLLMAALEHSDTPLTIDADWERQLDVLFRTDKKSRKAMQTYIKRVDEESLEIYLSAAFEGMLRNNGNGLGDCGKCFVEVASISPSSIIGRLAGRATELLPALKSNNQATRMLAAEAFGILVPHPTVKSNSIQILVQSLLVNVKPWSTAIGADANNVHGSILALGHILSRASYYANIGEVDKSVIHEIVVTLLEVLTGARDASTKEAVFNAVGQISASGVLTAEQINQSNSQVDSIIKVLTAEAKKGNEKAICALGRFTIVFESSSEEKPEGPLSSIQSSLYGLFELKQAESHFSIGEALSCLAACWESDALLLSLDVDTSYRGRLKRPRTFDSLLEKLLQDCKTTKPSLKKASGIWLFSLIQYCGHLSEIQSRLRECQATFMGLLSARDELVQETASRGLSLVYEQGDKELREKLVKDLVASFTGTSAQLKVDEETELFEPGALPTGEGKSVTSYKDIISLANEVGDQSLVYKFMSLASNAATWSTRAAFGRFGLSGILSESEIDPKLYPKLYRYRSTNTSKKF
jgi:proteasome component ECM29